ncbi:hypothetical protein Tsubulata_036663 [Turnera subulata]|uniref:Caffeoyl-CoA O-methyltransferase n=1 Tax=Turnera subulata TaxID=218843 RepID=A0A9Q0G613_9ROSI|nr:hypothetical protein Tsubulata_036663 [Turnera subulata]
MDINKENYELGLPVIEKAGVAHKIDFREGPALPVVDQMIEDGKYHGTFDFIFVDADKDNYINYHKRLIDLVKVGGVIGYDNTLWNGSVVAPPDAPMRKYVRYYTDFVLELNKALVADPRIEICMLPGAYFIFEDADKDNYINYHKRLIDLVKVGRVIGYDNTLWNGAVVAPPDDAPMRKYVRVWRIAAEVVEAEGNCADTKFSRSV